MPSENNFLQNAKVRNIFIALIVLILLIGAIILLKVTDGKNDSNSNNSSSSVSAAVSSRLLYDKNPADIRNVKVKNAVGEFEIVNKNEELSIPGFEGLPLITSILESMISNVSTVTAKSIIEENATDFGKYGLTNPTSEIVVEFNDASKKKILIGDATPISGRSYMIFEGESTVYTVDYNVFANFTVNKNLFINTALVGPIAEDGAVPRMDEMIISRPDLETPIKLIYNQKAADQMANPDKSVVTVDSLEIMVEPIRANLRMEKSEGILQGIYGLTAIEAIFPNPTPQQFTEAGLDENPALSFSMKSESNLYDLKIGGKVPSVEGSAEGYYGYFKGIDVIYKFSPESLPWLTVKPLDITSSLITLVYIMDMEKLEVQVGDEMTTFDISSVMDGEDELVIVKKNGETMDADYFKKFYQYILSAPGEEIWTQEPTSDIPDAKIVYHKENGGKETVEFFTSTDRKSIIKYNGEVCFRTRTAYVDRLIENLKGLNEKKEIVSIY